MIQLANTLEFSRSSTVHALVDNSWQQQKCVPFWPPSALLLGARHDITTSSIGQPPIHHHSTIAVSNHAKSYSLSYCFPSSISFLPRHMRQYEGIRSRLFRSAGQFVSVHRGRPINICLIRLLISRIAPYKRGDGSSLHPQHRESSESSGR